jgi:hypothetical protein
MAICDFHLGMLFFQYVDMHVKYDASQATGSKASPFDTPWQIALVQKDQGFNIVLIMILAGMFLGIVLCLGCVIFFRRGSKGGKGKENILEDYVRSEKVAQSS